MTTTIDVPLWPAATDNISWSADNNIAVTGQDTVAILIPDTKKRSHSESRWLIVVLKATDFTEQDISVFTPICRENWSIGEEISTQDVQTHAWSLPGLSIYDSCALALLHSNCTLAIWACTGRATKKDNWQRMLIVNHAIKQYMSSQYDMEDTKKMVQQLRIHQRVRTFTWLPSSLVHVSTNTAGGDWRRLARANQIVTVANDNGSIIFIQISSKYDILSADQEDWRAEVLLQVDCASAIQTACRTDPLDQQHRVRIDHLLWADVLDNSEAVLYFVAEQRLFALRVIVEASVDKTGFNMHVKSTKPATHIIPHISGITGPLRRCPGKKDLICFAEGHLLKVALDEDGVHTVSSQVLITDGWSDISGACIAAYGDDHQTIQVSTHLRCEDLERSEVTLFDGGTSTWSPAGWNSTIKDTASIYAINAAITGSIQTRTSGLAVSPARDKTALCVTTIPAECAIHEIQSELRSTILISQIPGTLAVAELSFEDLGSMKGLVLSIQDTERDEIRAFLSGETNATVVRQHIMARLKSQLSTIGGLSYKPPSQPERLDTAIARLHESVYGNISLRQDMLLRLVSIILNESPTLKIPEVVYHSLVATVLDTASITAVDGRLSRRILAMYQCASKALHSQAEAYDSLMSIDHKEKCTVCDSEMSFEAFRWVRCASGHRFGRCPITLLPITTANLSKSCELCGAQYLDEFSAKHLWRRPAAAHDPADTANEAGDTQSQDADIEPTNSFARVLIASMPRCIFCQGRFVY